MVVIGIVGGVASGKSHVADQFRSLGAEVIDADQLGHEALSDASVIDALRRRWGDDVLDDQGRVNRTEVARRVFPEDGQREELAFLESVTHPLIRERMLRRLQEIRESDCVPVVVLDAALLMEAGWDRYCDRIVFVDVPAEQRRSRASRRGWQTGEFEARERAQLDLVEKRGRADWAIDNSGTTEHTLAQVQQFWQTLG